MENPESRTSISFSAKASNRSEAHEKLLSPLLSSISPLPLSSKSKSASTLLSLPPRLSQESQIRCRLFYRLGIDPKQPVEKYTKSTLSTGYYKSISRNLPPPFFQPIRDNVSSSGTVQKLFNAFTKLAPEPNKIHHRDTHGDNHTNKNDCTLAKKFGKWTYKLSAFDTSNRRTVRFDNNVLVVPIPSRHAYSNRTKKALWRDRNELRDTIDRNRCEFLSEGCDFSRVLEDQDMYFDVATGEKIHPYWVESEDDDDGHEYTDSFNATHADIEMATTKLMERMIRDHR